jgi:hypothetical protein
MNVNLHPKFLVTFEALKNCLVIMNILKGKIDSTLDELTEMIDANVDVTNPSIQLYIDVVSFIDFANRFNELFDYLPNINKKEEYIKGRVLGLRSIGGVRNYLQHIRGDLKDDNVINYPVLGTVSWIKNGTHYGTTINQQSSYFSTRGITLDIQEGRYLHEIEYSVKDIAIGIDKVHIIANELYDHIAGRLQFSDQEFSKKYINKVHHVKIELTLKDGRLPSGPSRH